MTGRAAHWHDARTISALVEVIDNRSGIAAKIQSQLSIRFFTAKGVGEGTGLGLDIVHQHGNVRFESRAGVTRCPIPVANGEKAMMFWLLDWSGYQDSGGAAITEEFYGSVFYRSFKKIPGHPSIW